MFIISLLCAWQVRERFLLTRPGGLQILSDALIESKRVTLKSLFKSLALFNTQLTFKGTFTCYSLQESTAR